MTLTEFLLARIAEDEIKAQAATPGPWHWEHADWDDIDGGKCVEGQGWDHHGPDLVSESMVTDEYGDTYNAPVVSSFGHDADRVIIKSTDGAHIARHDPARVLADCEAHRRIVEYHTESYGGTCDICEEYGPAGPCRTLRLLALPYADHPDYREEWRP